jgi:hypothetical protein
MGLPDNPRQLPEFRSRLLDFLATPRGRQQFDRFDGMLMHPTAPRLFGDERDFIRGEGLWRGEADALGEAVLFYASENMTRLAVAAAPTMPEFALRSFDLPAEKGFIYYEKPIGSYAGHASDSPGDVVAVRWEVVPPDHAGGEPCVWMSFYSNYHSWLAQESTAGKYSSEDLTFYLRQYHELCLETFTFRPINGPDGNGDIDGYEAEWSELDALRRVLFSSWLLLKQPLTSTTEVEPDRAARRRMKAAGHEPAAVRVIELRRVQSAPKGAADREYHHQWIVRGHWRQHWFPAHEVHRPVWIAPHIKGPEGAPMLGGEKVYAWKR